MSAAAKTGPGRPVTGDVAPGNAAPDQAEFARLTDPFRPELLAHCYRMLGSVHDAEDQVQETLLRAWRSFGQFEGRSSLRTWLYRIATNTCLRAIETRRRRPLPSGLGQPGDNPAGPMPAARPEVPWLEPFPDALLPADPSDPASIAASRAGIRLAFIAALQYLPARQRAVLILRDVLGWRASEVAELLGTTATATNSALQRARAQLEQAAPREDELREPADPGDLALLDRYATAFENADIATLTGLLRDDVIFEMPPLPGLVHRPGEHRPVPAIPRPAPARRLPDDPDRRQRPARPGRLPPHPRRHLPRQRHRDPDHQRLPHHPRHRLPRPHPVPRLRPPPRPCPATTQRPGHHRDGPGHHPDGPGHHRNVALRWS